MERLSEMFPGSSYQTRLDQYLNTKGITDAAQLENYVREFNYSHKGNYPVVLNSNLSNNY